MNAQVRPAIELATDHTSISAAEFRRLAEAGFTKIPLLLRKHADFDTPLSLYRKLTGGLAATSAYSFLLESVIKAERVGRYSFIGLPARTVLRARGNASQALTEVHTDGRLMERHVGNPLEFIEHFQRRCKVAVPPGLPRFCGGLCGYFSYDTVRYIEPRLAGTCKPDALDTPEILLLLCDELAVVDNLSGTLTLIVYADVAQPHARDTALQRLQELAARVEHSGTAPSVPCVTPRNTSRPVT
jgi:anthranilate synthase component I